MTALSRWSYDLVYRVSKPRWDRGEVPPEIQATANAIRGRGRVLDLGCGTGTNAIYLAQKGFTVTGVDFSSKAIELARAKALQENLAVDFQVADVTKLDFLQERFDLVLDVGCLHSVSQRGREEYALHATRLTQTGSRFMIWAFDGKRLGVGFAPGEAQKLLEPHFFLERIEHGHFHKRPSSWYWFLRK